MSTIDQAFIQLDRSEEKDEILFTIVTTAAEIWETAGVPDDFCIQHLTGTAIVFGSTNRVIWTPKGGFRADRALCTQRFLQAFDYWRA